MTLDDLLEKKQEGVKYTKDDRGNVIMTLTEYGESYMLKDGIDEHGNHGIATYLIPMER
jgi:hypothetical protein